VRSGGVSPLSHAARLSWVQTGTCTTTPHPESAGSGTYSNRTLFNPSAISAPLFGARPRLATLGLQTDAVASIGSQECQRSGDYLRLDVRVCVIDVPTDHPFSGSQCSRPAHSRVLRRSGRDYQARWIKSKGGL
jgi:hypothetical protein